MLFIPDDEILNEYDTVYNAVLDDCGDSERAHKNATTAVCRSTIEQASQPQVLTEYDAGILNDWGGGNVEWWQDYIRAELGRAYEFYQTQVTDTNVGDSDQASQPQVPKGYKLVPVEPTKEMLAAAFDIHEFPPFQGEEDEQSESIYKAMLEAAPAAPKNAV